MASEEPGSLVSGKPEPSRSSAEEPNEEQESVPGFIQVTSVDGGSIEPVLFPVGKLGADKVVILDPPNVSCPELASIVGPLDIEIEHRAIGPAPILDVIQSLQDTAQRHEEHRDRLLVNPALPPTTARWVCSRER